MPTVAPDPICPICGSPVVSGQVVVFEQGELIHIDCHAGRVSDLADRVIAVLARHPGKDLCYTCLAFELNVAHQSVQKAVVRLRTSAEVTVRLADCSRCHHPRVTVRTRMLERALGDQTG